MAFGEDRKLASIRLLPLGTDQWQLTRLVYDGSPDEVPELVAQAVEAARSLRARSLVHRPLVGQDTPRWQAALRSAGFVLHGERVEYDAPVSALPIDEGSPLGWRTVEVEEAAPLYAAVAAGDPHGLEAGEDPLLALRGFLSDPELGAGPECVQAGALQGQTVALVIAQVAPADGWGRITYMGLVPGARGRELGKWVHRRGFRMLAEQGGKLYHGGTSVENAAMVRLFEKHGCRLRERMHEWQLIFPG